MSYLRASRVKSYTATVVVVLHWLVVLAQLRTRDRLWLALPQIEFWWGIIASYHDWVMLAVLHQHCRLPGSNADIAAYGEQCKRLELQQVAEISTPHMKGPFRHIHIVPAEPVALTQLLQVKAEPVKGKAWRTKATLSTERTGQASICLMADYFTKAAAFAPIPHKSAETVARAVHDCIVLIHALWYA